ncbi:peptidase S41, partial [Streptomyces sp. SID8455]|nr:peptidase S41 [Streptomyces sp. SID8455]
DAVEIAYLPRASGDRAPRRLASGQLGRVQEMISDPDGERLAIASNDGRLLLLDTGEPEEEPLPDERVPSGSTRADLYAATGAAVLDSAAPVDEHPGLTELIRSVNGPVRDLAF